MESKHLYESLLPPRPALWRRILTYITQALSTPPATNQTKKQTNYNTATATIHPESVHGDYMEAP